MNRVLAAERLAQEQLVEARTQAERARIEAASRAQSELEALRAREESAGLLERHPALLRLKELETLHAQAQNAAARLYVGFDKHATPGDGDGAPR